MPSFAGISSLQKLANDVEDEDESVSSELHIECNNHEDSMNGIPAAVLGKSAQPVIKSAKKSIKKRKNNNNNNNNG